MQDKIKNSYVSLMKISAPIFSIMNVSLGSSYVDKTMDMACAEYPLMEYLNKKKTGATSKEKLPIFRRSEKDIVWVIHKRSEKQEESNS